MTQISLSSVGVQYGATLVLRDVTVTIDAGERWGIIGRNGSGKTSLFRLMMGTQMPSSGSIARTPGLRFAVLDQHREFTGATTVWGAVAEAFRPLIDLEHELAIQAEAMASAGSEVTEAQLNRYARDLERFDHEGGYRYVSMVDEVLEGLGFSAATARDEALSHLSGGERGRVALARQLVLPADVLLLDEPTNHLDLDARNWLEEYLGAYPYAVILVSHDRYFLDAVVTRITDLNLRTLTDYVGNYSKYIEQRDAMLERLRQAKRDQEPKGPAGGVIRSPRLYILYSSSS
jgi:ATP-binding cassette subfamily F protein 3